MIVASFSRSDKTVEISRQGSAAGLLPQRNRSRLQRRSFACPSVVSHDGARRARGGAAVLAGAAGRGAGGASTAVITAANGLSASTTPPRGGSLFVTTTNFREGYLRKNGVPYSANANITEYFDKVGPEPNGDVILLVRTVVDDPTYLQVPFITSTHFKLEKDGAKWNPSPCKIDPPVEPGK